MDAPIGKLHSRRKALAPPLHYTTARKELLDSTCSFAFLLARRVFLRLWGRTHAINNGYHPLRRKPSALGRGLDAWQAFRDAVEALPRPVVRLSVARA